MIERNVQVSEMDVNTEQTDLSVSPGLAPHVSNLVEQLNSKLRIKVVPHIVVIDIEGSEPNIVEVSAIIAKGTDWIDARIWYRQPSDLLRAHRESRHCHCISFHSISKFPSISIDDIRVELKNWI